MSAMSAIEQPALRSGRITCWWSAGEDVGRLGHEVHAAEDDVLGLGPLLGEHRQPERVAPGVGPAHDLVALVVVAEDEERGRRARPWRRRSARRARRASPSCSARGAVPGAAACVVDPPSGWRSGCWPVGTAWSPATGMSASERICRRIPGRRCDADGQPRDPQSGSAGSAAPSTVR